MTSAVAYSTSKAAIISLSYPFAKQLSTLGIRVMDIAPGENLKKKNSTNCRMADKKAQLNDIIKMTIY